MTSRIMLVQTLTSMKRFASADITLIIFPILAPPALLRPSIVIHLSKQARTITVRIPMPTRLNRYIECAIKTAYENCTSARPAASHRPLDMGGDVNQLELFDKDDPSQLNIFNEEA